MICKHCQAENADDAVFCKNCGKRLDGMIECPECKTLNPEDSRFCKNCGKLLSGKNVCQKCGTEYEGKFCPTCGTSADGKAPVVEAAPAAQPAGGNAPVEAVAAAPIDTTHGWRKWVMLAGSIAGLVGVLLAVLFTYLIQIVPYGYDEILGAFGSTDNMTYGTYTVSLGWLLGDALDIAEAKMDAFELATSFGSPDFVAGYEAAYVIDAYIPTIFTLIVLWATILTVVINAIIAIIRYVNVLRGKPAKSIEKPTFAAILTFIFGACLIRSIWVSTSSSSMMGESFDAGYKFGGATVAGIVLTCLCLCLFIGSRIAVKGKELIKVKSIVGLSACALGIVFISVVWSAVTGGAIGSKTSADGYSSTTKYGFPVILQTLNLSDISGHVAVEGVDNPDMTMIALMSVFGFIGVTLVSALALSAMTKYLTNVMEDEKKSTLADSIVLTIFSVIFFVICIVTVNELFDYNGWDESEFGETPDKVMTAGILAFVFALLTLVASIAEKVVNKVLSNKGLY